MLPTGFKRAAAWALGRQGPLRVEPARLIAAARAEPRDEPMLAMVVAAARLGGAPREGWEILASAAGRTMETCYGPRAVAGLSGAGRGALAQRWVQQLHPGASTDNPGAVAPEPPELIRARLWQGLQSAPDQVELFEDLAAQQDPRDLDRLTPLVLGAGRRASHILGAALGEGDPRGLPRWTDMLRAVDVDPGAGFIRRARAARALGRLGLPEAAPLLVRALEDEALDHEGRPGAGLGVQLPVRDTLLAALGECGDARAAAVLARYLGHVHGSAQGGFHLQAMDALRKIGAVEPVLAQLEGPEIAAANALGVLAAMGRRDLVERVTDPRGQVQEVRRRALEQRPR